VRRLLSGAVALLLVVTGLAVVVASAWGPLVRTDTAIVTAAHGFLVAHPGLVGPVRVVTDLGSPVAVDIVAGLAAVVFALRRRWLALVAVATARLGELGSDTLLKHLVGRPRPSPEPVLATATGFSHPSGHAGGTAAVACVLALLALGVHGPGGARPGRWQRWLVAVTTAVVVVAVAGSRVLLGVHYPSDVVGGALLGAAWALLAVAESTHRSGRAPATPAGARSKESLSFLRDDRRRPRPTPEGRS